MVAGLTIYNTGNTVQIDENWKNYGFKYKIPVTITSYDTTPPNPSGYNGATYQLVFAGSPQALVACRASVLMPVKQHSYYDGSNWYLNWIFMKEYLGGGGSSETVEFFVFDAMNSSYSNVGLEVFDSSGARVYHSDATVMRLGGSSVGVQACSTPFYGDSGRQYVPLILIPPFVTMNVGSGYRHFSYSNRSMGSYIAADLTRQLGVSGSFVGANTLPGLYAAIDVTGL